MLREVVAIVTKITTTQRRLSDSVSSQVLVKMTCSSHPSAIEKKAFRHKTPLVPNHLENGLNYKAGR